ncbi:MAG: quinolinate synthase NadA [Bacteroidia bacterium]|nr:quinolinate synthase NadA [Bacteroidia bacterium]
MLVYKTVEEKMKRIDKVGFLDLDIDPTLDLFEEIEKLKKEKNAILLAHYYQEGDIQDVADFVGDSLGLAQQAAKTDAEIIVFAGVHFMAETAKILNPHKTVLLPDLNAGCSLSDSCPPEKFAAWKAANYPDHKVVTYINCSAALKAMSDVIVTSSNAIGVVESFPKDEKLIFAPDKNLGAYVAEKTGRDLVLWNGSCMVHEIFSYKKAVELKTRHPQAQLIAHPECESHILELADFIGSTTGLLKYTQKSDCKEFIVLTESGILHKMRKESPDKIFHAGLSDSTCACNDCPHMKLNTMEKLYICLKYGAPEVTVEAETSKKALLPIQRMLDISAKLGL